MPSVAKARRFSVGAASNRGGTLKRPCRWPDRREMKRDAFQRETDRRTIARKSGPPRHCRGQEQEVKEATVKAFRQVAENIRVPGFRPGKAPKHIIDRLYGSGVYEEEAHRIVIDRLYRDAVKQEEIIVVGQPSVEITEVEPLSFKVTVPVFPSIEAGDYASVRVEPRDAAITDGTRSSRPSRNCARIAASGLPSMMNRPSPPKAIASPSISKPSSMAKSSKSRPRTLSSSLAPPALPGAPRCAAGHEHRRNHRDRNLLRRRQ